MNRRIPKHDTPARSLARRGFTLIELLMVIVIISLLVGLLLPAIIGAVNAAKRAAVSAEINQLAQALANFKSKYGDYPPSRFLAIETGDYTTALGNALPLNTLGTLPGSGQVDPYSPGDGDITVSQLAQRSVAAIRKFWPRVSTTTGSTNLVYDFNGNGASVTTPETYVLHGHECLVFFLGGVPSIDSSGNIGMNGFDKNPQNPFTTAIAGSAVYGPNRQPPLFEFSAGRLFLDPLSPTGVPGYVDSIGNGSPQAGITPQTLNFYAYFSSYGNGGYDPNDVNFAYETDANGNGPIGLSFLTAFPIYTSKAVTICDSYAPNPYTSTSSAVLPVTYQNPQTFQIISSGFDGLYGVGGQYTSNPTIGSTVTVPYDATYTFYGATNGSSVSGDTDKTLRYREQDNLTNFKSGPLQ
jgi:general secretion pathway protein G